MILSIALATMATFGNWESRFLYFFGILVSTFVALVCFTLSKLVVGDKIITHERDNNSIPLGFDESPVVKLFKKAIDDAGDSISRIREQQDVTFSFRVNSRKIPNNNSTDTVSVMVVEVTHKFTYVNESCDDQNFSLVIYSDFRKTDEFDNLKKKFHFKLINLGDGVDILFDGANEQVKDRLEAVYNDKLYFEEENIVLEKGATRNFLFKIYSEYQLTDRLTWSFQELARNATIRIKAQDASDHSFVMKINHPLERKILKNPDNRDGIKNDGSVELNRDKYSEIKFSEVILPNQGFELSWSRKQP